MFRFLVIIAHGCLDCSCDTAEPTNATGRGIERAGKATSSGLNRAVNATERGLRRAGKATGKGIRKGGEGIQKGGEAVEKTFSGTDSAKEQPQQQ